MSYERVRENCITGDLKRLVFRSFIKVIWSSLQTEYYEASLHSPADRYRSLEVSFKLPFPRTLSLAVFPSQPFHYSNVLPFTFIPFLKLSLYLFILICKSALFRNSFLLSFPPYHSSYWKLLSFTFTLVLQILRLLLLPLLPDRKLAIIRATFGFY